MAGFKYRDKAADQLASLKDVEKFYYRSGVADVLTSLKGVQKAYIRTGAADSLDSLKQFWPVVRDTVLVLVAGTLTNRDKGYLGESLLRGSLTPNTFVFNDVNYKVRSLRTMAGGGTVYFFQARRVDNSDITMADLDGLTIDNGIGSRYAVSNGTRSVADKVLTVSWSTPGTRLYVDGTTYSITLS